MVPMVYLHGSSATPHVLLASALHAYDSSGYLLLLLCCLIIVTLKCIIIIFTLCNKEY